jgi:hypothetical protein
LERILVASPKNVRARRELSLVHVARGRALLALGRTGEALAVLTHASAMADSALAAKPRDWEWRKSAADGHLALGEAQRRAGDAAGATTSAARALATVDSTASASRATDMLALQASALAALGRADAVRPVVAELVRRGYRSPSFMMLLRGREPPGAP